MRNIRKKIAGLTDWIKAIKEELSQPPRPWPCRAADCYEAGTPEPQSRIGNLKDFAEAVNFLTERGIALWKI